MAELTGLDAADPAERFRAVGTGLLLAVVGFVAGIVTARLLATLLTAMGYPVGESVVLQYAVVVVSLQGIGFAVTAGAFVAIRGRMDLLRDRVRVPTLRELGITVGGIVGLLVTLMGIQVVLSALNVTTPTPRIVEDGLNNPGLMLYMVPLSYLLIGPGEELLFRGMVQGRLREAYAAVPAIALASIIFSLAHVTNVLGAPVGQQVAYLSVIFTLSLLLGGLYEYTENLVVNSLVHGTYNALLFLVIYAQAVGIGTAA